MKNILFLSIIIFCSISTSAQKTWSIQDCIEYAIEHNLQIQQQELSLQDTELNKSDALGNFLPNLESTISNNWQNGFAGGANGVFRQGKNRASRYRIESRVTLFDGLRNYNRLQSAKMEKVAAQYNIESIKDNIRLNIANNYLQVLLQQENLEVLNANHQITLAQIERTKELVNAGNLPEGDLLELKATYANEEQRIAASKNSIAIAKIGLKRLLNLNFELPIKVKKIDPSFDDLTLLNTPINNLLSKTLEIRNEVKQAEQNVNIAEQNIKISKGAYYPTLTANINYGSSEIVTNDEGRMNINPDFWTQIDERKNLGYGFRLNIPIFSRFSNKNSVSRSEIRALRSQFQLEQTKQRLSQNVYEAYLDAKASKTAFEAAKTAVTAQEKAYEYARNRYEVGMSNSLNFSQAQVRLQNSQTQLVRAKYDLLFKLKLLELYYTGNIQE